LYCFVCAFASAMVALKSGFCVVEMAAGSLSPSSSDSAFSSATSSSGAVSLDFLDETDPFLDDASLVPLVTAAGVSPLADVIDSAAALCRFVSKKGDGLLGGSRMSLRE